MNKQIISFDVMEMHYQYHVLQNVLYSLQILKRVIGKLYCSYTVKDSHHIGFLFYLGLYELLIVRFSSEKFTREARDGRFNFIFTFKVFSKSAQFRTEYTKGWDTSSMTSTITHFYIKMDCYGQFSKEEVSPCIWNSKLYTIRYHSSYILFEP